MSNMYSLLNYIAATSKDLQDGHSMLQSVTSDEESAISQSALTGLRGMSEDDKRVIGISTISVVTRLALEFKTEEVNLSHV